MDITDFQPFEVAGFTLGGYKFPDGSVNFGETSFLKIPKEITCNKVTYTLEEVKEFPKKDTQNKPDRIFFNAEYV